MGGKYRIIAHLRGGDATEAFLVSAESDAAAGTLSVMKRLKLGADAEPKLLDRFGDEARLCKRLDHPNLAKLVEAGQDEQGPLLVFEYIEGPTLARLRSRAVRRSEGLPVAISLYIVKEIAKGLAYAHSLKDEEGKPLKVVHRDVSPESVTVTYEGEVKLSDFGMATTVASTAKSREERVKGNVAYMAPEQARSEFALDPRADLFALGVILWELLTGKRLWEGLSEVDVLAKLADEESLPSARSVTPSVPKEVDAVCSMALTKVRDERYDSIDDFLEAIDQVLEKKPELVASAADVGALVSSLFEDERSKMQSVVADARKTATDSAKELPAIGAPAPTNPDPFVDLESDPKLRFGLAKPEEIPEKRVVEVIQVAPSPDRRFAYLLGAVVVLVVGAVAVVALRSPKDHAKVDEATPYVAPTRPRSTGPEPSASAGYVEPKEVTVEIHVTPPDADLFVDGVKATSNPHRVKVVPGKYEHKIHAEAEDYEPRDMKIAFDRERSIDIALVPIPKTIVKRVVKVKTVTPPKDSAPPAPSPPPPED